MTKIYPVILAGGSGTRLWPLSRKSYPKQFSRLMGEASLFQQAATRLTGDGIAPPLVLTAAPFRFIVTEQLAEAHVDATDILIEPEGRNTGPAILAASLHLAAKDPGARMLVAPSDHIIPDAPAFKAAVAAGLRAVDQGRLVTFGITPDRAETGYGYLELDTAPEGADPLPLVSFVEKPKRPQAEAMLAEGRFLWNAGIFLAAAADLIAAFEAHAPTLMAPARAAMDGAKPDLGFLRLDPEPWGQLDDISVDYAVMEKADNLSVVPFSAGWSDLGSWDAVLEASDTDANGVAVSGPATALDCQNTLLRAEDETQRLVGLGLKNIAAIAMPDAVLVADMSSAQGVKQVVSTLKASDILQAETFPRDHRPWGWFESLAIGRRFQVKRIVVHPGAALSLQSHVHRAEHWIVVEGTAKVTIDDDVKLVSENQSVYIPLGAVHRMENPGKVPMVLIEVQTGSYLGEDDIIRYQDVYARA